MDMRRMKMGVVGLGVTALIMSVQPAPAIVFAAGDWASHAFKALKLAQRIFGEEEFKSWTPQERWEAGGCVEDKACLDMLKAGYPDVFKDK
jgi:hypothetical protein